MSILNRILSRALSGAPFKVLSAGRKGNTALNNVSYGAEFISISGRGDRFTFNHSQREEETEREKERENRRC